MTSQDLVPDNLPYGERQNTVDRMQQAGVPLESQSQTGGPSSAPAPPAAQGGPSPSEIDALSMLEPTPQDQMAPPMPESERLRMLSEQAQNTTAKIILRRLAAKA